MPLKVEIFLDAGHGGDKLSGFWIARCDSIRPEKRTYTYQVSAKIHPWRTITEFTHMREDGHLLLVSEAIVALHREGYRAVQSVGKELHDKETLEAFRIVREELGIGPADFF